MAIFKKFHFLKPNVKLKESDSLYTGYFTDGTIQTYHDFIWSAKSKISGEECRATHVIVDGEWEGEKITKTNCYVDPTATSNEVGLYQEKNK